jgi:hypothetical protein
MRPRKARRRGRLRVTLYSEPGYRGLRQRFGAPSHGPCALTRNRLPTVGSIKVERFDYTFRRASAFWMLLRSILTGQGGEEAVGWLPLAAMTAISPASWLRGAGSHGGPAVMGQVVVRAAGERSAGPALA